eukprot:491262_1
MGCVQASDSNLNDKPTKINYSKVQHAMHSICIASEQGKPIKLIKKELLESGSYTKNEVKLAIKCIKIEKYENKNANIISKNYNTKYNASDYASDKLKDVQKIIKSELIQEKTFDMITKTLKNDHNYKNNLIHLALSTITIETYARYDEIPPIFSTLLVSAYIRKQYNKEISTDVISLIFTYIKKRFVMYGIGNYLYIGLGETPTHKLGNGRSLPTNVGIKYAQPLSPKLIPNVSAVFYGDLNFVCLTNDNKCYVIGMNNCGQLCFDPNSEINGNNGDKANLIRNWRECDYFKENNIKIKFVSGNSLSNTSMFYVDINNNIYGCGLNRGGDLGIDSNKSVYSPVLINEYNEVFKNRNNFEIKQIVIARQSCSMILTENGNIYISGGWYRLTDDIGKFQKFNYFSNKMIKIIKIALPIRFDYDCYFLDENGTLYVYVWMMDEKHKKKRNGIVELCTITYEYPDPEDNHVDVYESKIPIYECKFFSRNGIKIRDIEAGKEHLIVLDQYFKVWTFGENDHWQCGTETDQEDVLIPVCVSEKYNLLPIKRIKGGGDSTILVTFGDNFYVFGCNSKNCLFTKEHDLGDIKQPFYVKSADILPNHSRIVDVVCNSQTGSTIIVAEC